MSGLRAAALDRIKEIADRAASKPQRSDAASKLRWLADQVASGRASDAMFADAGAVCLLGLEGALEAQDRMRRNPIYTHAAMSAQAMESNDG